MLISSTVYCKGPQEEEGSWVQGQAEGHTQGVRTGNSTGRGKANDVVWEIRQEVDDRKSDRNSLGTAPKAKITFTDKQNVYLCSKWHPIPYMVHYC